MIRRETVFVRAQLPNGRWVSADVLDLTQESFNAFVLGRLHHARLVAGLRHPDGEEIPLQVRPDREHLYKEA
jgi:hypothetical protein